MDYRTIWHQDNLAPQWKRDNLAPECYQNKKCNFKMREKYFVKWKRNTLSNLSQPSARRAHRHPPTVIYPPNVGRKYPIQIYLFNWHICNIFVCLLRKMMVPNCPFYTAVPNCPGAKLSYFTLLVPNCPRCQIVLFYTLGAKLSLLHCGAKLS